MSHETPELTVRPRERTGSRYAKRLRSAGELPAVIYGHKQDPVHVSVDEKELLGHLHHGSHVFSVSVDGAEQETCLVKDLQFGFLGDNVIHIDFARVDLDEEVSVQVHLRFVGEAEATKRPDVVVSHPITELEVICKVSAIPEEIRVDLSPMEGTTLTVGEIELPEGIRTNVSTDTPLVVVSTVHAEEAVGEEAEVATGEAEPEVITESKPEDTASSSD